MIQDRRLEVASAEHRSERGRRLIGWLALGLTMWLLGMTAAAYAHARLTEEVCPPPGQSPRDAFADDDGSTHEPSIDCAASYGIVEGFDGATYRPTEDVSRAQMATLIAEFITVARGRQLSVDGDTFADDDGSVHEYHINALAKAGVVRGREDGQFDPQDGVDRAAMATFVANAIDYVDDAEVNGSIPPPREEDQFGDDDGSTHEPAINRLAEAHIVTGSAEATYRPDVATSRAQTASFVVRAAAFLNDRALWYQGPHSLAAEVAEDGGSAGAPPSVPGAAAWGFRPRGR